MQLKGIQQSLERRRLGDDSRSALFARAEVRRGLARTLRRAWPAFALMLFLPVVASVPYMLLGRGLSRWIVLGAAIASGPWMVLLFAFVGSGVAPRMMGATAESRTASELRRLHRRGWTLVNGARLRWNRDIDHLLVGPGGVLVVETKWSGDQWPGVEQGGNRFMANRLDGAISQAAQNRDDVASQFARLVPKDLVRGVLVLWSTEPGTDDLSVVAERAGVTVLQGSHLREWLEQLPVVAVPRFDVEGTVAEIVKHIDRRRPWDDKDAATRPRPTLSQACWRWVLVPVLAAVASVYLWLLVAAQHTFAVSAAVTVVSPLAGLFAARSPRARPAAVGWTVAGLGVGVALAVLFVAYVVR